MEAWKVLRYCLLLHGDAVNIIRNSIESLIETVSQTVPFRPPQTRQSVSVHEPTRETTRQI